MIIVLIFLIICIKFNVCVLYVDLKENYISPGVLVHHGIFLDDFSYRMYVGQNGNIEMIKYGEDTLFPTLLDPETKYKLMLEYFQGNTLFAILHVSKETGGGHSIYFRIFYIFKENTIFTMDTYPYHVLKTTRIRLSLDINQNSYIHPFIKKIRVEKDNYAQVKYELMVQYRGVLLNGSSSPFYQLGYIFDSEFKALIGYKIYDDLMDACGTIRIEYRDDDEKVIIENKSYIIYKKILIYNKLYWSYSGSVEALNTTGRRHALSAKNRIDECIRLIGSVKLDVSENVSPAYYSIAKITGLVSTMAYTRYESRDDDKKIKELIDTRFRRVSIFPSEKNETVLSVEVYVDHEKMDVVINLVEKTQSTEEKKLYMFGLNRVENKYRRYEDVQVEKKVEEYKKMYPIYLNVDIDEESLSIYERIILNDDLYAFNYYYINQYDNSQEEIVSKYVFESLTEVNPYIVGNIPSQIYKPEHRIIRNDLSCREFIIRNPFDQKPMDPSAYEVYVPIT